MPAETSGQREARVRHRADRTRFSCRGGPSRDDRASPPFGPKRSSSVAVNGVRRESW